MYKNASKLSKIIEKFLGCKFWTARKLRGIGWKRLWFMKEYYRVINNAFRTIKKAGATSEVSRNDFITFRRKARRKILGQ